MNRAWRGALSNFQYPRRFWFEDIDTLFQFLVCDENGSLPYISPASLSYGNLHHTRPLLLSAKEPFATTTYWSWEHMSPGRQLEAYIQAQEYLSQSPYSVFTRDNAKCGDWGSF